MAKLVMKQGGKMAKGGKSTAVVPTKQPAKSSKYAVKPGKTGK
jgi:hypothetical protein